jgi:hypothetical protein
MRDPHTSGDAMTTARHIAAPADHPNLDNPLDRWGRRIAFVVAVVVAAPTLVLGIMSLLGS